MKTLEDIYADMFEEHERIFASNPYGCNQYGHRKGHNGGSSSNKSDSSKKEEAKQKKNSEDKDENKSEPANEKREGEHFDNIQDGMVDAVAKAIISGYDVWSNGFSLNTMEQKTDPPMQILIPREELRHLHKEYKKGGLNPWDLAKIFVKYDGKRAWNKSYSPKYPSRKK